MERNYLKIILSLLLITAWTIGCGGTKFGPTTSTPKQQTVKIPDSKDEEKGGGNTPDLTGYSVTSYKGCFSYIAYTNTRASSDFSFVVTHNKNNKVETISCTNNSSRIVRGHSGTSYQVGPTGTLKDPKSGYTTSSKSIPAGEVFEESCDDDQCKFAFVLANDSDFRGGAIHSGFISKFEKVQGDKKEVLYQYYHKLSKYFDASQAIVLEKGPSDTKEIEFDDFCFPVGYINEVDQ